MKKQNNKSIFPLLVRVFCACLFLNPTAYSQVTPPENVLINGDFSQDTLKWYRAIKGSKAVIEVVPTEGVKYPNALKVQAEFEEGMRSYDISFNQRFPQTFTEGSTVVMKFWARAQKGGQFAARVQSSTNFDILATVKGNVRPTSEWHEYVYEGRVGAPDKHMISFQFGLKENLAENPIEIAGVEVYQKPD